MFAGINLRIVKVPNFRTLVFWIPLAEAIAEAEKALFSSGLLFVAPGPANAAIKTKLLDGTEFDGIAGLRSYLLTRKKDVFTRLFCRRLLGYALGRAVTLSDTVLLDEMVAELNKHDGKISAAMQVIVRSPQFRMVRGSDFGE